jgi:beta-glucosidase
MPGDDSPGIVKKLSDRARMEQERSSNSALGQRMDELLNRMTLEEKIGQMTMINFMDDPTSTSAPYAADFPKVDQKQLLHLTRDYQVGFMMSDLGLTPAAWYRFIRELQEATLQSSRLKIPMLCAVCHMHGATFLADPTIFPHNINLAATFNPRFAEGAGRVTVLETADLGHLWLYTPVLDCGRNPRWAPENDSVMPKRVRTECFFSRL